MADYVEMIWRPNVPSNAQQAPEIFYPYAISLIRRSPGAFVGGEWVEGTESVSSILANVQPAGDSEYSTMQASVGGERVGELIRIYTATTLLVPDPQNDTPTAEQAGDIILWDAGNATPTLRWLVVRRVRWANAILSHNKYLAQRITSS